MSPAWVVDLPLTPPEALAGLRCEEANVHGVLMPSRDGPVPAPCGQPATTIVWHQRPGERQYAMCDSCAAHNVRNRGGTLLLVTRAELRMHLMRKEHEDRGETYDGTSD